MVVKKYILVIDEGTTSTKAFVFDKNLRLVSSSQKELSLISSAKGQAELDGDEILNRSIEACKEAIARGKIQSEEIACIGIDNQRNTIIAWDKETGKPVNNAICWQDHRVLFMSNELKRDGMIKYINNNHGSDNPNYGIFLVKWFTENIPGFLQKIIDGQFVVGSIDSWLINRLTDGREFSTSYDNLSYLGFLRLTDQQISTPLLKYLGLPSYAFPIPQENSAYYGMTDKSIFGVEIPITGVICDQHAAMYAQRIINKGDCKCTNGTGSFVDLCIGNEYSVSFNNSRINLAWKMDGKPLYVAEAGASATGTFLKWIRDNLGIVEHYNQIDQLAESVIDSNGVMVFPTLFGVGFPKRNPAIRASIMGISESVKKSHIALASLEGIANMIRFFMESMIHESQLDVKILKVDGGITNSDLFCHVLANTLDMQIERAIFSNSTALGTAEIAGKYFGLWHGNKLDEIFEAQTFKPKPEAVPEYQFKYDRWQMALLSQY